MEFESERDGDGVGDEEGDVEQEKEAPNRVSSAEIPRDWSGEVSTGVSLTGRHETYYDRSHSRCRQ